MPSCTDEQKRRAVDMVEECGGSVTRAMLRLGYPTRQTLHQCLNQRAALPDIDQVIQVTENRPQADRPNR